MFVLQYLPVSRSAFLEWNFNTKSFKNDNIYEMVWLRVSRIQTIVKLSSTSSFWKVRQGHGGCSMPSPRMLETYYLGNIFI